MRPWIAIAVIAGAAGAADTTGPLHRQTLERLAAKPVAEGRTVPLERFHIYGSSGQSVGEVAFRDGGDCL
jgi:hypothetical protein